MTDQFAVVDFTTPATAIAFDITSPLITETCKAAVCIFSATTTDDSAQAHAVVGISFVADDGHVDETTAGLCVRSTDALTTTQTARTAKFAANALGVVEGLRRSAAGTDSGVDVRANYTSFISGGLRLTATTVTDRTKGSALLIAGVTRAYVGIFTATAVSAHENVGSVGNLFQPDLIIFSVTDSAFADPSVLAPGIACLGFTARSPAAQGGAIMGWNNGADPSDGDGRVSTTEVPSFDTSRVYQGVTITIDSTGFNHIRSFGAGSPDGCYLALQFSEAHRIAIQALVAPSGTGNVAFTPGFPPSVCLGMSTLMTSTNTDIDGPTASSFGYFMFTPTAARAVSGSSAEGLTVSAPTPSIAKTIQGDHAIQTLSDTGALAQQASWVSAQDTGFTLNFTTATSGLLSTLMIGPFVNNETVTISETSRLIHSTLQLSETVGITETSRAIISAFQANETVSISESVAVESILALGETVTISESSIFSRTSSASIVADKRGGTFEGGAVKGLTDEGGVEAGYTTG